MDENFEFFQNTKLPLKLSKNPTLEYFKFLWGVQICKTNWRTLKWYLGQDLNNKWSVIISISSIFDFCLMEQYLYFILQHIFWIRKSCQKWFIPLLGCSVFLECFQEISKTSRILAHFYIENFEKKIKKNSKSRKILNKSANKSAKMSELIVIRFLTIIEQTYV